MSTLFVIENSPRGYICIDIIKRFNLDVKISYNLEDEAFRREFPLGRTPTLLGPDNLKLQECLAISNYLLSLVKEHKLYGNNAREQSEVIQYFSYVNSDLVSSFYTGVRMLTGSVPYDQKAFDNYLASLDATTAILETKLSTSNYLVGNQFTLADAYAIEWLSFVFSTIGAQPYAQKFPKMHSWFDRLSKNEFFCGRFDNFKIPEKPMSRA